MNEKTKKRLLPILLAVLLSLALVASGLSLLGGMNFTNASAESSTAAETETKVESSGDDEASVDGHEEIIDQEGMDEMVKPSAAGQVWSFGYTKTIQSVSLTAGVYKLQVWGAEGATGYAQGTAGKGGFSEGVLTLTATTTLYVVVGGTGRTSGGATSGSVRTVAGYNGGGTGNGSTGAWGGAGGGATHIATASGLLSALSGNKTAIKIVAGGGGGGGHMNQSGYAGGGGGGTNGIQGGAGRAAGTQSSGNAFGQGGSTSGHDMGAGGGGYWGGYGSTTSDRGGSGGSGYIGGVTSNSSYGVTARTIAGNASMPNTGTGTETGHAGDGYAKITQLNDKPYQHNTPSIALNRASTVTVTVAGSASASNSLRGYDNDTTTGDVPVLANTHIYATAATTYQ